MKYLVTVLVLFITTCLSAEAGIFSIKQEEQTTPMYEYSYSEEILQPLTLFGGLKNDTYFVDVLKYFDSISSVSSIVADMSYDVAGMIDRAQSFNKNYKGKIQSNILSDVVATHWDYYSKYGISQYSFVDNSKIKALDNVIIYFEIKYVVIANIPYKVTIVLKPQVFNYYYNKTSNLKMYNNTLLPFYEVDKIVFSPISSYKLEDIDNLLNLYKNKYQKYEYNPNPHDHFPSEFYYSDDNVTIRIEKNYLKITYFNEHFGYYKNKYKNYIKEKQKQIYSQQNQNGKI